MHTGGASSGEDGKRLVGPSRKADLGKAGKDLRDGEQNKQKMWDGTMVTPGVATVGYHLNWFWNQTKDMPLVCEEIFQKV